MKWLNVLAELVLRILNHVGVKRQKARREEVRSDPVGEFNRKFGGVPDDAEVQRGAPKDTAPSD